VGNAQVEITQHVLVHEVEPVPAADVAVCGQWNQPVAVDEVERCGMALRGVGEAGEDVPWDGDEEEGLKGGEGVKFAQAMQAAAEATCEKQVDGHDRNREDDADEAFGEDVEGAGGGEASAVEAQMRRMCVVLVGAAKLFGAPEAIEGGG